MTKLSRFAVGVAVCSVVLLALISLSTRPAAARPPGGPKCECANLDAPVICKGGKIYANPCVANCFGATGCVPYGG